MPEIEAKLLVRQAEHVEDVLGAIEAEGYRLTGGRHTDLRDIYFDTKGWALFRAGWVYRCRNREEASTLMLKATRAVGGHVFVREEITRSCAGPPTDLLAMPR